MKTLRIDIETFSRNDIKSGVYKYVECHDFAVMLFGYAYDGSPVMVVDLINGGTVPESVLADLINPDVLKTAFNANFERVCLSKHLGVALPIEQWKCTSVLALELGLPQHLADVAKALKLPQDKQKMTAGKRLIKKFCCPSKPTKKHPTDRWYPIEDPESWALFIEYCRQDVEVERAIATTLQRGDPPQAEWEAYWLDQKINDTGIKANLALIKFAINADRVTKERITAELTKLTGLDNPNSVAQLKRWLEDETFEAVTALNKETLPALLASCDDAAIERVLRLRQEAAKTSVKKYVAMDNMVTRDGRIHGLLQFYGANRTGRWAGRGVQIQNLPKSYLHQGSKKNPHDDLDTARRALMTGDSDIVEMLYGNVPDTLSQLIRTAFEAPKGQNLLVIDFSAIEARMLAWLANEQWRIDVFTTHGKIYEASAAAMFNVPIESIDKGSPLRFKGKVSELALGYQGGPGALITMGALKMGLTEDELPGLVKTWRSANTNIQKFWYAVDSACYDAVAKKGFETVQIGTNGDRELTFECNGQMLFVGLPSGRRLAYVRPRIELDERFGKDGVTYEGLNQDTKQWQRIKTYGGKLVENICQATCRDLLRDSMFALDAAGYKIVAHVHDEVLIEYAGDPVAALHDCEQIMGRESAWAPGLPLRGDGFFSTYYKKGD